MYRFNIQQGNVITPDMLAQVKPGMSGDQVRYIMGTPVLNSTFNPNRWDYVYTYKPGGGKQTEKRVTMYFVNGFLQRIEYPHDSTKP
jgi:outer membrane protein assembly factor BamE